MSEAWMIGPFVIKYSLLAIVIGIFLGFLYVRYTMELPKEIWKKTIDEVGNMLFLFLVFMWVGKIIFHFQTFIQDPIAILAYPSDSKAFYVGTAALFLFIMYKVWRKSSYILESMLVFLQVFLVSSFIYEFAEVVLGENTLSITIVFLFILLIALTLLNGKISVNSLFLVALLGWSISGAILSMSIFYFSPHILFYIVVSVLGLISILWNRRVM
ncbi:hypothetical protein RZN22_17330 [Bacillaceae bacterium S4-13-58]